MRCSEGFTAVELLVALVIGALLLGSGYQLYTAVIRDSNDNLKRSQASGAAYQILRQNQNLLTSPCTSSTRNPAIPAESGLGTNASAELKITCPYNTYNSDGSVKTTSNISLMSVTITYHTITEQKVTRAIAIRP